MLKWHRVYGLEKRFDGKWEAKTQSLDMYRASIPGGWLVMCHVDYGYSPTFVPDPEHIWDGSSTDYDQKVDGK